MNARVHFGIVATLGLIGSSATAVVINPGQTSLVTGTTITQATWLNGPSPGASFHPVIVVDQADNVIYSCNLLISLRVTVPFAQPALSYRIQNTWAQDPSRRIVSVSFSGYKDLLVDAEFRTDIPGQAEPKRVSRSADGDTLTFEFESPIEGGISESRFFFAFTNAVELVYDGTATVTLQTGESQTITDLPRPKFGGALPPPTCEGDSNGDGVINFADLNGVLTNFGEDCP
jgi:hypothetical protein